MSDWPQRLSSNERADLIAALREERAVTLASYPDDVQKYFAACIFLQIPLIVERAGPWLPQVGTIYGYMSECAKDKHGQPIIIDVGDVQSYVFPIAHLLHVEDWKLVLEAFAK